MPEKITKAKKLKGKRKHGFLKRNQTKAGRDVIKRRRDKGRKKI